VGIVRSVSREDAGGGSRAGSPGSGRTPGMGEGSAPPGSGTSAGRTGSDQGGGAEASPGSPGNPAGSGRSAGTAPASAGSGAAASAPKTSTAGRGAADPQRARRLARAATRSAWWSIGRPTIEHPFDKWKGRVARDSACPGAPEERDAGGSERDRAPGARPG
jgi:hypothetical protein